MIGAAAQFGKRTAGGRGPGAGDQGPEKGRRADGGGGKESSTPEPARGARRELSTLNFR